MAVEVFSDAGTASVLTGGTAAVPAGTVESWSVAAVNCPTAVAGISQFRVVDLADPSIQPEVILVTAGTNGSGTWTVTRGAEGTVPFAHLPAFTVVPIMTNNVMTGMVQTQPHQAALAPRAPRPRPNPTMITTFQTGHGYSMAVTAGGTTNANDTTDYLYGTQAVSGITPVAGVGAVTVSKNAAMSATDLTTKYVGVLMKMDRPDLVTSITIRLGTGAMAAFETLSLVNGGTAPVSSILANQWAWVYTSYGNLTSGSAGSPNRAAITDIQVRTDTLGTGAVTFHVNAIAYFNRPPVFPNGVVTFGFDDSYVAQFTMARPKLDQYNYGGVAYTIVDTVLTSGASMSLANLTELQESHGWQIAGHAYTSAYHNAGYSTLTAAQLDAELQQLRAWLITNNFTGANTFAYPLGDDSVAVDAAVANYFTDARTTVGTPFGSLPPDQKLRRRIVGIGATTPVATIQGYIDKAYTYGLWLDMVTHNILTSGASGNTQVLQSDFNSIVDYVAGKGIPVRTVDEVNRLLAANPAT